MVQGGPEGGLEFGRFEGTGAPALAPGRGRGPEHGSRRRRVCPALAIEELKTELKFSIKLGPERLQGRARSSVEARRRRPELDAQPPARAGEMVTPRGASDDDTSTEAEIP